MSDSQPLPGTGITAIADPQLRVFYQLLDDHLDQDVCQSPGVWKNDDLHISPVSATPLASVTWNNEKEIRVYYLDSNYTIQELCYTDGKGWYQGTIGEMKARATPAAGLAAAVDAGNDGKIEIFVYFQAPIMTNQGEPIEYVIEELIYHGGWRRGDLHLSGALGGTGLAAVAYHAEKKQVVRLYFQAADLSLQEYYSIDGLWSLGSFNPKKETIKATARTPISAVISIPPPLVPDSFVPGTVIIQVYWRDLNGFVVFSVLDTSKAGDWSTASIIPAIGRGYEFCVVQWDALQHLRIYYQSHAGSVHEHCSDDGGQSWYPGQILAVTVESVLQYLTN